MEPPIFPCASVTWSGLTPDVRVVDALWWTEVRQSETRISSWFHQLFVGQVGWLFWWEPSKHVRVTHMHPVFILEGFTMTELILWANAQSRTTKLSFVEMVLYCGVHQPFLLYQMFSASARLVPQSFPNVMATSALTWSGWSQEVLQLPASITALTVNIECWDGGPPPPPSSPQLLLLQYTLLRSVPQ